MKTQIQMMTSVTERCRAIATFRHISVRLMEALARWTPTTPEMEAKVMFGRHIWIFAQHADRLEQLRRSLVEATAGGVRFEAEAPEGEDPPAPRNA